MKALRFERLGVPQVPWTVHILLLLTALRIIAAQNNSTWQYADEWYQTSEFANLLVNGVMTYTNEVALHLRNLSWPTLLTLPLSAANFLNPHSIFLRSFLIQLFSILADLALIWGWLQVSRDFLSEQKLPKHWLAVFLGAIVLPWFLFLDAIKPSAEHAATISSWLSLGLLVTGEFGLAGFFLVGIAAFKYQAGLLSLGFAIAFCVRLWKKPSVSLKWKTLQSFVTGIAVGLVVFGLPDYLAYGRPWESLWMYLQYNVFSGGAAKAFGQQDARVYLEYFLDHWGGPLLPVAISLFPAAVCGLFRGLARAEYWAYGTALYLVGNLLTPHKEPRFMQPIEWMLVWGGLTEWMLWSKHLSTPSLVSFFKERFNLKWVKIIFAFCLVANLGLALHKIWGWNWTAQQTYFEINRHLEENPSTCAVISVRRPLSIDLPDLRKTGFAFFPMKRRGTSLQQALLDTPLLWIEKEPDCTASSSVLLHLHKPSELLLRQNCTLLESGILNYTPATQWSWILSHNYLSGPWYKCPAKILGIFERMTQHVLVNQLHLIETLPPLGSSFEAVLRSPGDQFSAMDNGAFPKW